MGKPSQEAIAEAKWQAFQTIEETADLMASYARSIGEAAYRGDEIELGVHIRQVIACARSMARVYREIIGGNGADDTGQKAAGAAGGGAAQSSGDGVDGRRSS